MCSDTPLAAGDFCRDPGGTEYQVLRESGGPGAVSWQVLRLRDSLVREISDEVLQRVGTRIERSKLRKSSRKNIQDLDDPAVN